MKQIIVHPESRIFRYFSLFAICCFLLGWTDGQNSLWGAPAPAAGSLICEQGLIFRADPGSFKGAFRWRIHEAKSLPGRMTFFLNAGLAITKILLNEDPCEFSERKESSQGRTVTVTLPREFVPGDELSISWQGNLSGAHFKDGKYFNDDSMYFLADSRYFPQLVVPGPEVTIKRSYCQIDVPEAIDQFIGDFRILENEVKENQRRHLLLEFTPGSDQTFYCLSRFSIRTVVQYGLKIDLFRRKPWGTEDESIIPPQSAFLLKLYQNFMPKTPLSNTLAVVMEDPERLAEAHSHAGFMLVEEPTDSIHHIAREMARFSWNGETLKLVQSGDCYFSPALYLTEGMSNFLAIFGFTFVNAWYEFFVIGSPVSFENAFELWYVEQSPVPGYLQFLDSRIAKAEKENALNALKQDVEFNVKFSTMFLWALMTRTGPETFFPALVRFHGEIVSGNSKPSLERLCELVGFSDLKSIAGDIKTGMKFIRENWRAKTSSVFSWYKMKAFCEFAKAPEPPSARNR